jgi:hypothetical protein
MGNKLFVSILKQMFNFFNMPPLSSKEIDYYPISLNYTIGTIHMAKKKKNTISKRTVKFEIEGQVHHVIPSEFFSFIRELKDKGVIPIEYHHFKLVSSLRSGKKAS